MDETVGRISTIIALTSCSLSVIGGFFIIYTYVKIEALRKSVPRTFLVYITCADLLISSGYIVGSIRYTDVHLPTGAKNASNSSVTDNLCKFQSFMTTYGTIASFVWTDILAIYLYRVVKYDAKSEVSIRLDTLFHFFGWIMPGVIVSVVASYNALGEDNSRPWCWVRQFNDTSEHLQHIIWMFVAGKAWEIITYLLTVCLYVKMKIYLWKRRKASQGRLSVFDQELRKEDEYFWLTWIILISLRLAGTIRIFIFLAEKDFTDSVAGKILLYIQSFGDGAQAFVNCICYCAFDSNIWDFVKKRFLEYKQGFSNGIDHEIDYKILF